MNASRAVLAVAVVLLGATGARATRPTAGRALDLYTHEAQLLAPDGAAADGFGYSVSVSGDTAVVSAPFDDTSAGLNAGSAYVFVRSGSAWTLQQKLQASDGEAEDNFGSSASITADTVVIGAARDDTPGGVDVGAAYVFVRSGGVWTQQQKLVASDGAADDVFGAAVSVSGDIAVVGAFQDDAPGLSNSGSAYVFVRSGGTWTEQQKLGPPFPVNSLRFGYSLSVVGDTLLVGAPNANFAQIAKAFVFVRSGAVWTQEQELVASDAQVNDDFGAAVSLWGDTAAVGANFHFAATGSAYVFVRSGTTWTQQQKLVASDGAPGDHFGSGISLAGDTVVVGAFLDDLPSGADAGSGYVFVRTGTTWTEQRRLVAPDAAAGDAFGSTVAVSAATVLVGASSDDTASGPDAGSAHVFRDPVPVELQSLSVD
jgi:hypothetical protein